jgi:hypothetical protein
MQPTTTAPHDDKRTESPFRKKRSKRLFCPAASPWGLSINPAASAGQKVFWFFSSEKNNFLPAH